MIEASAGTGKTYTIQYMVLDLLLKGLKIPEILVVTFTEAATQELSERLQSFLVEVHDLLAGNGDGNQALHSVLERARAAHGGDAVRRCIRQAMLEVDQAPIYTIHGFCQRALQENAFAADANFDAELCAEITPVVQGWVMDFLRRVHLDLPVRPPKTAKLDSLTQRALKLTGMLRMRDPDTGNLEAIGQDLAAAVQRLKPTVRRRMRF